LNYKNIIAAALGLSMALVLAGCGTTPSKRAADVGPPADARLGAQAGPTVDAGPPVTIYVIKRSWHTDIGFDAADLHSPLATLRLALPEAHYLLFGFGDKHYLMTRANSFQGMVGAVWPGDGLVLVTGLEDTPEQAFGVSGVVRLRVSAAQARRLEEYVWNTLATENGVATAVAPGPYEASLYYGSTLRYSGLHTCNTWTAAGLQTAGLPIRSFGVEFSGQVWRQVRRLTAQSMKGAAVKDGAAPEIEGAALRVESAAPEVAGAAPQASAAPR
jgi:uncharacterized protein (TIGR02117 family)